MSDIRDFCPLWGEWEADTKLGEGSFGAVWKVRRNVLGGRIYYAAVKHISIPKDESEVRRLVDEGIFEDEQSAVHYYSHMLQSIADEIDAMHKLQGYTNIVTYEDHTIIPKVSGIGYDLFLRMELLTPLTDRIKQGMKTQDVVSLGKDIATAIDVLYDHSMIHRDIKPQNIFVNDRGIYKLGDYGTARALGTGATAMSRKGTYNYMSPEIYNGQKADIRADIYSLGLVLYRLLNRNRLPFLPIDRGITSEDSDQAVLRRISGEEIMPPRYADPELAAIVLKACAFHPDDRYTKPQEMIRDLERYGAHGNEEIEEYDGEKTRDDSVEFRFGASVSRNTGLNASGSIRKKNPEAFRKENREEAPERSANANPVPVKKEKAGRNEHSVSEDNSSPAGTNLPNDDKNGKTGKDKGAGSDGQGKKKKRLVLLIILLWIGVVVGGLFAMGILPPKSSEEKKEQTTETPAAVLPEEQPTETDIPEEKAKETASPVFTITWTVGAETDTTTAAYGEMPEHARPVKESDKQYTYTFIGWKPEVKEATENAAYEAVFQSTVRSYTITWLDDTGNTIDIAVAAYGTEPTHADPVKAPDQQYTYTFAGWQPDIRTVTGDAVYTASFKAEPIPTATPEPGWICWKCGKENRIGDNYCTECATPRDSSPSYTITWQDDTGKTIGTTTAAYDTVPVYDNPVKEPDRKYTYTFIGWEPAVQAATADATYKAIFKEEVRSYTITWQDDAGKVLDTALAAYDTIPAHDDPMKEKDQQYTYTFIGWEPAIQAVNGDAVYKAKFREEVRSYTITWQDDTGKTIDTTVAAYDTDPVHADPVKDQDQQYTYVFSGWQPELRKVTGDATYKATFKQEPIPTPQPVWTCLKCGTENPGENNFCTHCASPKGTWVCASCGTANSPDNNFCTHCALPKGTWICASCGTANSPDNNFCTHCALPKGTWICASCSTANSPDNNFCTHCATPKGAWVCSSCNTTNSAENNFCTHCATPKGAWVCSSCNTTNSAENNFCTHCATPKGAWICSSCKTVNSPENNFCTHCATPKDNIK